MRKVEKTSVMLTPKQIEKLQIISDGMGVRSLSLIVRWAVDAYFKNDPTAKRILTSVGLSKEGGK